MPDSNEIKKRSADFMDEYQGGRRSFIGHYFYKASFEYVQEVNLNKTILETMDFSKCILQTLLLEDSKLNEVYFNYARIKGGSLKNVKAKRVFFESASLVTLHVNNAAFSYCGFKYADIIEGDFVNNTFSNCTFKKATIVNTDFSRCTFSNTDLSNMYIVNSIFTGVTFDEETLRTLSLQSLEQISLTNEKAKEYLSYFKSHNKIKD